MLQYLVIQTFTVSSIDFGMKSSLNSTLANLRGVAKGCAVVVVVLAVVVDVPVVTGMVTVVPSVENSKYMRIQRGFVFN